MLNIKITSVLASSVDQLEQIRRRSVGAKDPMSTPFTFHGFYFLADWLFF